MHDGLRTRSAIMARQQRHVCGRQPAGGGAGLQLLLTMVLLAILMPLAVVGRGATTTTHQQQLPDWFVQHRTHAHTRFAPEHYCSKNSTSGQWGCTAAFENVSAELASLGVPVYVRQTHSREEGAWWPTKTTPKEGWAQLVQDTGRNLPAEFLAAAKAARIQVIFYHYMMGNSYWASAKPEWVARWPNGSAITTKQAPSGVMSTCAQPWRDIFIAQIKELITMGARAFYFDHYPGNPGGDWSESCRAEFVKRYGKPMPTGLTTTDPLTHMPLTKDGEAYSSSRQVLEFNSQMTQDYFSELVNAIEATAPGPVAALVSVATVPKLDGGQTELPTLYESSRLLSLGSGSEVCKNEYDIAGRTISGPGGDSVDVDILMSFGWSLARDGTADASPPHIWAPQLFATEASLAPAAAQCASAALRTYGAVANLDQNEGMIPDRRLFGKAYEDAVMLDHMGPGGRLLPTGLRPIRHVAVLFSEASRDALMARSPTEAWKRVLYPTAGVWGALVRARQQTGMVVDWQIESHAESLANEWGALVAPAVSSLTAKVEQALSRFESAGGVLVRLNASDHWEANGSRADLSQRFLSDLAYRAGSVPIIVEGAGGSNLHVLGHRDTTPAGLGAPNATIVYHLRGTSLTTEILY